MPLTIMCPNLTCRAVLRVPDDVRGKKIRCGRCATVFAVPQKSYPPVPAAPPAATGDKP